MWEVLLDITDAQSHKWSAEVGMISAYRVWKSEFLLPELVMCIKSTLSDICVHKGIAAELKKKKNVSSRHQTRSAEFIGAVKLFERFFLPVTFIWTNQVRPRGISTRFFSISFGTSVTLCRLEMFYWPEVHLQCGFRAQVNCLSIIIIRKL